ncbi:type II secretion system protein GspL [Brevundimonas sp.]|uniref:type II secretion system protein GspL n=1 Tax=Brevundimonas sp. TaxID=1871086 RepID=UPI002730815B|nr:type II secretion system protein GspL [Brevundimonas sp.]MDP1913758.1 type II secretion system protein GspL [Brevundimonas sp.]
MDRAWAGPLTVLVPSEKILTVVIDLPFASRRQRIQAAPYALEGVIAEPLDQVHVALGTEVSPRRHLCAVVRHSLMRDWVTLLTRAGLERCILLPDALALPEPPPGSWRVAIERQRAVVRTDDGGGFAVEVAALPAAWEAGGRPTLIAEGDPLPEVMREGVREVSLEMEGGSRPSIVAPPVDLRQGLYAAQRTEAGSPWKIVGQVAVLGVVAHLGLVALDTLALLGMADRREAETRRLIAERQPGLEASPDLVAAVDQIAPAAVGGDGPFARLFGRTSRALTGQPLAYRAISYGATGSLTLAITAVDVAAVDGAVAALARAAIPARSALDPVAVGTLAPNGVNAVITLQPAGTAR